MLRENASLFAFFQRVKDAVLVAVAFALAFLLRFHPLGLERWGLAKPHVVPIPLPVYEAALPVAALVFLACFTAWSLYEPRRTLTPFREALATLRASLAAIVLLVAAAEISRRYSRAFLGSFAVLAPLLLASERALERATLRALRRRGWNLRRALVVGEGPLAASLVKKLRESPWSGIEVVGALHLGDASLRDIEGVPVKGAFTEVRSVARALGVDQVLLAVPLERAPLLRELRALLDAVPLDLHLVPDTADFLPIHPTVSDLGGLPIVTIRRAPAVGTSAFLKRALDVTGAAVGLVLLGPLLAAIALAIRLLEGAPVLYRQERVGWGGRPFTMLKFRTMVADAETSGAVWATRGDPRRTRLGALLRRTSLDELPQLWNVLKGDMSLVGPRPERPEFLEEFRRELPDYMLRLTVKAGMTGLAQLRGLRGASPLGERLRSDLEYVREWSLGLDLKILVLTVLGGFLHENAY